MAGIDPDVDLQEPSQDREWTAHRWTLPTIAVGGVLGATARHAIELWWPVAREGFPWATFATNVVGCALLGLLMVLVVERGAGHPLLRPFAGVGVLGGFTTFSTYTAQSAQLIEDDRPALAVAYLFATLAAALVSVAAGTALARGIGRGLERGGT